jgi:ribosomal protein S17E
MKINLLIAGIATLITISGCANQAADNGNQGIYKESGNTINVNDQQAELYNEGHSKSFKNKSEDFGYVRHMRNPTMGTNSSNDHYAAIDREQLANIISQYSTDVPHVDDVSTLVTDEEVLIVYKTDSKERNETADQVKRMAMSVVPRFYHVYVSDNTKLRRNVENFATLDSDTKNVDSLIDGLISQMRKSPQGRKMNNSENPNGEMKGEQ